MLTFVSNGHRDQTQLAMGLTRRLKNRLQAGATDTLMFSMRDDGGIGYTAPGANNPFDFVDGEYATSAAFQRNTVRTYALYQLKWGIATSITYSYGSGNRFNASISGTPYGKVGTNRLNLTNAGGTANPIVIPAGVADRFDGPPTIASGTVIPRNALLGLPLHRVDLRMTKDLTLGGSRKATLIAEVFNVFNHANYGSYATSLKRDERCCDRALRPAAADRRQRLRAARGPARVPNRVLIEHPSWQGTALRAAALHFCHVGAEKPVGPFSFLRGFARCCVLFRDTFDFPVTLSHISR